MIIYWHRPQIPTCTEILRFRRILCGTRTFTLSYQIREVSIILYSHCIKKEWDFFPIVFFFLARSMIDIFLQGTETIIFYCYDIIFKFSAIIHTICNHIECYNMEIYAWINKRFLWAIGVVMSMYELYCLLLEKCMSVLANILHIYRYITLISYTIVDRWMCFNTSFFDL